MLTLLLLISVLSLPTDMPDITAPEVIVTIAPSSMDRYQLLKRKTPDTYTCRVTVRDAESDSPAIRAELVLSGGSDKVTRRIGDYTIDFSVTMKLQKAETDVTVKRSERVLTRQRSTVSFQSGQKIVPVD
jgi:hypothetical protein